MASRTGLRRALFIALTLSLVLPGLISGFILIYLNLQRTLDVETRVRAEKFADLLQAGLLLPLWEMTPEAGKPLLLSVAADPSVSSIEVLGPIGERLLEFHRETDSAAKSLLVSREIEREGELLGQVSVSYSTATARSEAARASTRLLVIITIQFLVSLALIGAWLSRRVLAPLETLRRSAEKIAAGDLQSEVPAQHGDEFGVLSGKLDLMRHSLAQSVMQLENRVEARTRTLQEVNSRLQETLEDLRRMQHSLVQAEKLASLGSLVAGVAHELNTPIGTAVTVVSTICEKSAEMRRLVAGGVRRSQLDSFINEVEEAGGLAMSNLERAARLVQDFKQVAVDQTSSRRRRFELAEVVREMMVAVRLRHKHAPVRIEADVPGEILIDSYPGALMQVITNLVENAVVHGADGRAECAIGIAARAADGAVTLTVSDNGNGIPADHLSRVFDPFFTTRMGKGGSGLGLSIVYGLVTGMLGGRISVASEPGCGTLITVELPLVAPEHPEIVGD